MYKRALYLLIPIMLLLAISVVLAQQRGMLPPAIGTDGVLSEEPYHNKWALLIGINNYPNLPVQYQLQYAENDVNELKKVLVEQYQFPESNIITLINEQATLKGIKEKFAKLSDHNKVNSDDCVLVYFSGHGQTVPLPRGGDMGYLIPYDAKVDMDDVNNMSAYYGTCLGMRELRELAQVIPAKHIMFLVDACYSGLAVTNRGGFQTSITGYLKKVASVPVQQIITAGMKGDMSSESPEWGHGAFTYKLLEALKTGVADENDDGVTTGLELAAHLKNVVPNISPKQTPQYGNFYGEGEFLFLRIDAPNTTDANKPDVNPSPIESAEANELPKEITGKDGAPMVLIPAGECQIGGNDYIKYENPVHTVYLDAFYMDVHEVTNSQYKKFIDATGYKTPSYWSDTRDNQPNYPVVGVDWNDAVAYAEFAGKRLPTEDEWEKAARGGLIGKQYPCGDTITHDDANFDGTGGKDIWNGTSPIGRFKPNGYGLYDMAGNVSEWCADKYYFTNQNPIEPSALTF